jgi:dihydroorotase
VEERGPVKRSNSEEDRYVPPLVHDDLMAEGGMSVLLRGGRVLDPSTGLDEAADVLIEGGKVVSVGGGANHQSPRVQVIEISGKIVVPGLVDIHVHLREPGREDEETIETGTRAAVHGGYTAVCCMPNTDPVVDDQGTVRLILERAKEAALAQVYPIGAITKGSQGEELSEIGDLVEAGCVAISDDGRPVMSAEVMRRALEYASMFDIPVVSHCEDLNLSQDGLMHEGIMSTILGMKGIPAAAEEAMVCRDLILSEATGGRLHIAHVSTAGSVELIRQAKARGVRVTCEATPHHLTLTDESIRTFDANYKVNPPLRSRHDVEALRCGLVDGTIDCIATDHAPHAVYEKEVEFSAAPPGMVGFETALGVVIRELVEPGILSLIQAIRLMSTNPCMVMRLPGGILTPGAPADLCVFDPHAKWVVDPDCFESKSRNTGFGGWELSGKVWMVLRGGRIVVMDGELVP